MATWISDAWFGVHYDFHANEHDRDLGAGLDAERLRAVLTEVRPDWIHCDGKGHRGYTSWPSQTGSAAPGIVRDGLAIHRQVTSDLGIRLGVHYSGMWDALAIAQHPEWACVGPDGERDPRITCPASGYLRGRMLPHLDELLVGYEVDALWVDGDNWAAKPCWCECCRQAYRDLGGGTPPQGPGDVNWHDWLAFHRQQFTAFVAAWVEHAHRVRPGCVVTSSYFGGARQPDPALTVPLDVLSGDLDFRWGAEHALLEARVYETRRRTSGCDRPWNLMAWMFTQPGQMSDPRPWLHKPAVHLQQEVSEVMAHGGAVMVYEKPRRDGHLVGWHHRRIAEVADFCRARQAVCQGGTSAAEVAVVHGASCFYRRTTPLYQYEPGTDPVEGALRLLLGLGLGVDVLTEDAVPAEAGRHRLIVVPEQTGLPSAMVEHLLACARNGAHLLVSDVLAADALDCGLRAEGETVDRPWLEVEGRAAGLAGSWQPLRGDEGEPLWPLLASEEVEDAPTGRHLAWWRSCGRGSITAIGGPLFSDFLHWPNGDLRRLARSLIAPLRIPFTVEADGPERLEVVPRRYDEELRINLINRGPAGSCQPPRRVWIEELPPVTDIVVRVRCLRPPRRVELLPSGGPISFTHADGVLNVRIPRLDIHEVLVVREG